MKAEDIREYARRDWGAPRRLQLRERARSFRENGSSTTIHASRTLWEIARSIRPEWPSERERSEDLAHHVKLKRRLDRAARAFRVR